MPTNRPAVRRRRPSQLHQPVYFGHYRRQGFKPFGLVALKTAGLIHHHHIEWPGVPVVIYQPADILPVDDIDVRRRIQRPDPFCLAAQYRGHPKDFRVIPFILLLRPGPFRYFFWRDHQDLPNSEPVILKLPDGGQGSDRLA